MTVSIRHVYDDAGQDAAYRVLVDRLWPRGLSKERARVDLWLKDIAPTTDLRKWWGHDPERLDDFAARYRAELDHNDQVAVLRDVVAQHPDVEFVYGAHDPRVNHAAVLLDYLNAAH